MSDPQALDQILVTLSPTPQEEYVFTLVDEVPTGTHPFVVVRDDDVFTVVFEKSKAEAVGLLVDRTYVHLSLGLQADLDSVGVTVTIAQILSTRSIATNPTACTRHDHLFARAGRTAEATQLLIELEKNTRGWLPHN